MNAIINTQDIINAVNVVSVSEYNADANATWVSVEFLGNTYELGLQDGSIEPQIGYANVFEAAINDVAQQIGVEYDPYENELIETIYNKLKTIIA